MDSVKVNGVELEFEVRGSGEPVLLIRHAHCRLLRAAPQSRHLPPLPADPLPQGGWVGSTHTPPPVSVGERRRRAAALLDHLGVRRSHCGAFHRRVDRGPTGSRLRRERTHLALLEPTLVSLPSVRRS